MPLLLAVAERERPGRLDGLDDRLFLEIQEELRTRFASESCIVAHGRVSVVIALALVLHALRRRMDKDRERQSLRGGEAPASANGQ